jgi:hypothetical protein
MAADVSNESTIPIISVGDQGNRTMVAAGLCTILHGVTFQTSHFHNHHQITEKRDGHAMGHVVSRRPLIAEARVRLQASLCKSCGTQCGTGTGSSPSTSVSTVMSILCTHISFT